MSISIKAIDRLFERLAATYGSAWTRQWADVPMSDVKTVWSHELAGYANHLEILAWALENLPERCPNVMEFKKICNLAPRKTEILALPKADPERLAAEMSKLTEYKKKITVTEKVDHKYWARRILQRHADGEKINPTSLRFAKEALQ